MKRFLLKAGSLFVILLSLVLQPVSAQKLDDIVEWTDSLSLEEPEGTYTATPMARVDSNEIVVTDFKESKVRVYDHTGQLKTSFGKKGSQAPGALRGPTAALRLPSDQFLVPDMLNGNISLFDEEGDFIKRHQRVVVRGNLVHDLPGDDVLLVGSRKSTPGSHPLLHRFNPIKGTIESSFFPHPAPLGSYGNYLITVGRIATADVRDSTIVAAFSITDDLYFYSYNGSLTRKTNLNLSKFRKLEKPNTEVKNRKQHEKIAESHSRIANVFWINEETILIRYRETKDIDSGVVQSNIAGVTTDGDILFEITDVPRLLAVGPENKKLYFDHPDYAAPNRWIVGRLKKDILGNRKGNQ